MTANATNGLLLAQQAWHNQTLTNPISILVLNLMPTKATTEHQFLTRFNNLQQDIQLTFMYPVSHHFRGTPRSVIAKHYATLNGVANQHFDGLIITGAPIEKLKFQQVDYWQEFQEICQWATTHVTETLFECWAAQAGLFQDFHIGKRLLPAKVFGVFTASKLNHRASLVQGFSAGGLLKMPQSRHTELALDRAELPNDLKIIADEPVIGPLILQAPKQHRTYFTGHPEYSADTLAKEYFRDRRKHLPIQAPVNYFSDEATSNVNYAWAKTSQRLYQNWTNLLIKTKVGQY